MIEEVIISLLANYLNVCDYELDGSTHLFMEYSLNDSDIEEIIEMLEDEFEIEINPDDFNELESIREIAEYIEYMV